MATAAPSNQRASAGTRQPAQKAYLRIQKAQELGCEALVNPDLMQDLSIGELIEVKKASAAPDGLGGQSKSSATTGSALIQITTLERSHFQHMPNVLLLVSEEFAKTFNLSPSSDITVEKVDKDTVTARNIELTFREQYISRSDMWRVKMALIGKAVCEGKRIEVSGVSATIKSIYIDDSHSNVSPCSGYVTANTRYTFRSETAKYFIFIQMSKEMFDFEENGELYFEKCVSGFLPALFKRWKKSKTNHIVSIVLFARVVYENVSAESVLPDTYVRDSSGRVYQDCYKVIVDWETRSDWSQILGKLKEEFIQYCKRTLGPRMDSPFGAGSLASSSEGNILEAINLALNPFDKHYIDRDFLRTGLLVVIITPGTGLFEVDKKLLRLTTQRMIDNGIGMDLVCLSNPPLHVVPVFMFKSTSGPKSLILTHPDSPTIGGADRAERGSALVVAPSHALYSEDREGYSMETYYAREHWIDYSFWTRAWDSIGETHDNNNIPKINRFMPRGKVPDIQVPRGMSTSDPQVPFLIAAQDDIDDTGGATLLGHPGVYMRDGDFNRYDEAVFRAADVPSESPPAQPGDSLSAQDTDSSFGNISNAGAQQSHYPNQAVMSSSPSQRMRAEIARGIPSGGQANWGGYGMHDEPSLRPPDMRGGHRMALTGGIHINRSPENYESILRPSSYSHHGLYKSHVLPGAIDTEVLASTLHDGFDRRIEDRNTIHSTTTPMNIHKPASEHSRTGYSGSYKTNTSYMDGHSRNSSRHGPSTWGGVDQCIINPYNFQGHHAPASSNSTRWKHVYPNEYGRDVKKDDSTNWKSLCTPACLPLTTDYFPMINEPANGSKSNASESLYREYSYLVSPSEDIGPYQVNNITEQERVAILLIELIAQRLSQGFQLILPSSIEQSQKAQPQSQRSLPETSQSFLEASSQLVTGNKRIFPENNVYTRLFLSSPCYLSLGDQVHKLFFDSTGKNVEVKRHIRNVQYQKKGEDLVSGNYTDMIDGLRFWRVRFLLVPQIKPPSASEFKINEKLSDEELRLTAFDRFIEFLEKSIWIPSQDSAETEGDRSGSGHDNLIKVQVTTFTNVAFLQSGQHRIAAESSRFKTDGSTRPPDDAHRTSRKNSVCLLTQNSPLVDIACEMQHPKTGLRIINARWHFKYYENIFIGKECVQWLIDHFSDISTKDQAIAFGNELMAKGVIEHPRVEHKFLDGYFFYRFTPAFFAEGGVLKGQGKSTSSSAAQRDSSAPEQSIPALPVPITGLQSQVNHDIQASNNKNGALSETPFLLSRQVMIDLDPGHQSHRREIATLHYDTLHNSRTCFHLELHWLVCSPRLIQEQLSQWYRMSEKIGLKLLEAPVIPASTSANDNPFQSIISITLACQPPSCPDSPLHHKLPPGVNIPTQWFESELLMRFGFILDLEADHLFPNSSVEYSYPRSPVEHTQFIHLQGIAIIQIREPGQGFYWINNRLRLTGGSSSRSLLNQAKATGGDTASAIDSSGERVDQAANYSDSKTTIEAIIAHYAQYTDPDLLRDDIVQFVQNAEKLEAFWSHSLERLRVIAGYNVDLSNTRAATAAAAVPPKSAPIPEKLGMSERTAIGSTPPLSPLATGLPSTQAFAIPISAARPLADRSLQHSSSSIPALARRPSESRESRDSLNAGLEAAESVKSPMSPGMSAASAVSATRHEFMTPASQLSKNLSYGDMAGYGHTSPRSSNMSVSGVTRPRSFTLPLSRSIHE
ncbi:uncharacterized protein BJ171DRAFT_61793 [Polychytrium aggregatum]|uniref:uncharacterized protein n=1 Tax=Polychytrium aggregatum TaxID=110093 RepID=UPI0022FE2541|nr:uncharacterized protein BJ171DRAFT_61793 [Polychytrium aggregatum]KAI9205484.1 hypothetical protein BJ171DRAFT_61793 [Polychytrium aggregatum]